VAKLKHKVDEIIADNYSGSTTILNKTINALIEQYEQPQHMKKEVLLYMFPNGNLNIVSSVTSVHMFARMLQSGHSFLQMRRSQNYLRE